MVWHHMHSCSANVARASASSNSLCIDCTEKERQRGYRKKDFKQAKLDFVDQMLKWSGATSPAKVLDVGCGIGGTTRILAKNFPGAQVQGSHASRVVMQSVC